MTALPSIACLQAFESVARHGSITRAAKELNLTQSAVSRQIYQLESLLDVSLFDRVRQRVVLTDAGRLYLKDINGVMAGLKNATGRIMACGGSANLLNLAVLPTFATRWLIPRMSQFLQQHPGVTVNFSVRLAPFDFREEPFDSAIHYGSAEWPGAATHLLMNEDVVPVCSPKFAKMHRIQKPVELIDATLLHQSTRTGAWAEWFESMSVENSHPFRGPKFEQFAMIAQAAVCGLGVALLPKLLIEDELKSGKLALLFPHPIHSPKSYYVVVPDAKAAFPLTAAFVQWIVHKAKLYSRDDIGACKMSKIY